MFWWIKQRLGIMKQAEITIPEFDDYTFVMPFQMENTSICDELIKFHKDEIYYKHPGTSLGGEYPNAKKSTDVNVWPTCSHPTIETYKHILFDFCTTYFNYYDVNMGKLVMSDAFNIQHYKPGEGFFAEHYERNGNFYYDRVLVFMTYLNDVEDGGGTHFRFQNLTTKAKKGLTLLWPSDFTHIHNGIVSPTEHKYIATGWFNYLCGVDSYVEGVRDQMRNEENV